MILNESLAIDSASLMIRSNSFLPSSVFSHASSWPALPSRKSKNPRICGSAIASAESAAPYALPNAPPRERMTLSLVLNTASRLARFAASVIASESERDASPSASPIPASPSLITSNAVPLTIWSIAFCRSGRNAAATASLSSSIFGFRLAINFANVFCDSVRPSSGSPPAAPPLAASSFARANSVSARFCASAAFTTALPFSVAASATRFSASAILSRAAITGSVPSTPSFARRSCSFARSELRSFARRRFRSASANASSASLRARELGGRS